MALLILLAALAQLAVGEWNEDLHNKYLTMPLNEFVVYFNKQNYSWKITEYDEPIEEKFTACDTIDPYQKQNFPVVSHDPSTYKDLPEKFDSRDQWSQCETIQEIYDQAHCGSCWTFGTATTASDRSCIHKNVQVRLSEEDFECMTQNVCNGSDPFHAFNFWKSDGLVTQGCKPYNVNELLQNVCNHTCANSEDYAQDKHFGDKVYAVSSKVDDIKVELVKNGPIQASFNVYEDIYNYHTGVYVHSWGKLLGGHSVRLIGYGVENGLNYWLAANSWGTVFGEQGFFKIQQEQPDVDFETNLCTGLPKN